MKTLRNQAGKLILNHPSIKMDSSAQLMPPPRGNTDAVVQGTNDDAQISKLYAACLPLNTTAPQTTVPQVVCEAWLLSRSIHPVLCPQTHSTVAADQPRCACLARCVEQHTPPWIRLLFTHGRPPLDTHAVYLPVSAAVPSARNGCWLRHYLVPAPGRPTYAVQPAHQTWQHRRKACNQHASLRLTLQT